MSSMSEDTLPRRCCASATPLSPDEIRNPVVANGFMAFCGTPGTEGTGKKSRKRWKILQCPYDAACFLNEPGNVFFTLDPQSALRKESHSFDATVRPRQLRACPRPNSTPPAFRRCPFVGKPGSPASRVSKLLRFYAPAPHYRKPRPL